VRLRSGVRRWLLKGSQLLLDPEKRRSRPEWIRSSLTGCVGLFGVPVQPGESGSSALVMSGLGRSMARERGGGFGLRVGNEAVGSSAPLVSGGFGRQGMFRDSTGSTAFLEKRETRVA
jgi:hypothetical protein